MPRYDVNSQGRRRALHNSLVFNTLQQRALGRLKRAVLEGEMVQIALLKQLVWVGRLKVFTNAKSKVSCLWPRRAWVGARIQRLHAR